MIPSSQHSRGRARSGTAQEQPPRTPSPLANAPRASLPPRNVFMGAQWVLTPLGHLSWEGAAGLQHGAEHGAVLRRSPGKARCWLPPSCCAAEMRRKTTLGASPHLPSSPRAAAPPALSSPSASSSFISSPEVRIIHLLQQPPPPPAARAGIVTQPDAAGTKWR